MVGVRGSCLCGGVKFEITGPLSRPLNCHCVQCRKQHGAAFRSRVRVRVQDLKWIEGEELIKYYEVLAWFSAGLLQKLWFSFGKPSWFKLSAAREQPRRDR